MKYCENCFAQLEDEEMICHECGKRVGEIDNANISEQMSKNKEIEEINLQDNINNKDNGETDNIREEKPVHNNRTKVSEKRPINELGIVSFALGMIGIVLMCFFGISGILGIVGLILGITGLIALKDRNNGLTIAGIIFSSMALALGIGWLFIYVDALLPIDNQITDNNQEVKVEINNSFNSEEYIGLYYEDVKSKLNNKGFNHIEYEVVDDLDPSDIEHDGKVVSIIIDGKESFKTDNLSEEDVSEAVTVVYHIIPIYETKIIVDFSSNLLLNKYNIQVYIDEELIEELKHGQDLEKYYQLKAGKHTIKFAEEGSSSVYGEADLMVNYPTEVKYKINNYADYVNVVLEYENHNIPLEEGKARMSRDEKEFRYMDYKDVEKNLRNDGFNNIIYVPEYDIYWGITPSGEVDEVYVNGFNDFKKGDIFNIDDEIKIVYHMPYQDDPEYGNDTINIKEDDNDEGYYETHNEEEKFQLGLCELEEEIVDQPFVEVRDMLRERGYNLEYKHEDTLLDFTGELNSLTDEELNESEWIVRGIDKWDYEYTTKTIVLYVNSAINIREQEAKEKRERALESKLPSYVALGALEIYGQNQFKYGFKIHMIIGKLGEEVYDENTWSMKYKAKYKDSSGQWIECICEGKITGTEDNPQVYDFLVY